MAEDFSIILRLIQDKLTTFTISGSSLLMKDFLASISLSLSSTSSLQEKLNFLVSSKLVLNKYIASRIQHKQLIDNMKTVDNLCLFALDNILSADSSLENSINIKYN